MKSWYQQIIDQASRSSNQVTIKLKNGGTIRIWTHPGSSPFDQKVLDIQIHGVKFDQIRMEQTYPKRKVKQKLPAK